VILGGRGGGVLGDRRRPGPFHARQKARRLRGPGELRIIPAHPGSKPDSPWGPGAGAPSDPSPPRPLPAGPGRRARLRALARIVPAWPGSQQRCRATVAGKTHPRVWPASPRRSARRPLLVPRRVRPRPGLAMVRVLAVWPGAVHRARPELAAFVHLMADGADDGNLREILWLRGLYHTDRHPGARHATVRWPSPPVSPYAARSAGQSQRVKDTSTRPGPHSCPCSHRSG
jgi:hypothetical protein